MRTSASDRGKGVSIDITMISSTKLFFLVQSTILFIRQSRGYNIVHLKGLLFKIKSSDNDRKHKSWISHQTNTVCRSLQYPLTFPRLRNYHDPRFTPPIPYTRFFPPQCLSSQRPNLQPCLTKSTHLLSFPEETMSHITIPPFPQSWASEGGRSIAIPFEPNFFFSNP